MRKYLNKASVLVLALSLLFLTACGGATIESYQSSLDAVTEEINANNTASLDVDYTDSAQVTQYVKDTKAIYQKLTKLKAPEELAQAQEKVSGGADKMLEYLDRLPAYLEMQNAQEADQDAVEAERMELLGIYSEGVSAIAEGYNDVTEAAASVGDVGNADNTDGEDTADGEEATD